MENKCKYEFRDIAITDAEGNSVCPYDLEKYGFSFNIEEPNCVVYDNAFSFNTEPTISVLPVNGLIEWLTV